MTVPLEKGELSVDDCLKKIMGMDGTLGYIVFNQDGIPLKKYGQEIDQAKSVQIASLVSDFIGLTKKVLTKELRLDQELEIVRIRTKKYTEMIIVSCPSTQGDFTIVCFQQCDPVLIEKMRAIKLLEKKDEKKTQKKGKLSKEKEEKD